MTNAHREIRGISRNATWITLAAVVVLVAIWAGLHFVMRSMFEGDLEKQGQFGDQFGSINALFSALSLGGVILAILIQSVELQNQVAESRKQAKALVDQQESLKASNQFSSLEALLRDYRSAQTMDAIKSVWDFRRSFPDTEELQRRYILQMDGELKSIDRAATETRLLRLEHTLHYKRRHVEHIYYLVASAVDSGMLQASAIYAIWNKGDLEIIPKVLFPIAQALESRYNGRALSWDDYPAASLYDNAPD